MKTFAAASVLALVLASPVVAAQTHATTSAKSKVPHTTVRPQAPAQAWPYSTRVHKPEYDVYVNGEYAGSDPDPRVRYELKREYCAGSIDGCGF